MDWQYIQPFFTWLSENPAWAGLIVFLIALSESLLIVGLIVPGTVLMFGVGTLVGTGVLGIQETLLFAFFGAVLGDGVSYWVGARYHQQLANIWPLKNNPSYLTRGKLYFKRHGGKSVFFGRFVGPIRPIIPAVAGMMGMPVKYFFTVNVISAAVWALFYLMPGIVFGTSIGLASIVGMRLVVLLLILFVSVLLGVWLTRKFAAFVVPLMASFYPKYVRVLLLSVCLVFVAGVGLIAMIYFAQDEESSADKTIISNSDWYTEVFASLPDQREDVFGRQRQNMNLQWAGNIEAIKQSLLDLGWEMPIAPDYRSILYWLNPDVEISELPRIPQTHDGEREALVMIKYFDDFEGAYVVQLWSSSYAVKENNSPLWVGSVTRQVVSPTARWLAHLIVKEMSSSDLAVFEGSLKARQYDVRHAGHGILLISGNFSDEK